MESLKIRTDVLEVAYEAHGPADGPPVILLHGFPYDPRCFDEVAPPLAAPFTYATPAGQTVKVAVTALASVIVTVQSPTPLHAPDQPMKRASPAGAAVMVSAVP